MYINEQVIKEMEEKYGKPKEISLSFEIDFWEKELIRRSQRDGREHDVTLFIFKGNKVALIRKSMFPPGAFRAPSGGIHLHEKFETGAKREAYEETGLEIELEKYVLRVKALFTYQNEKIPWISHIFTAKYISGELQIQDTSEIEGVEWGTIEALQTKIRDILLKSGRNLFKYRVALTDAAIEAMKRLKTKDS